MTAAERLAAAEMTLALSQRVSYLADVDKAADAALPTIPTQRGVHHAR
jgi:hypothetical protein